MSVRFRPASGTFSDGIPTFLSIIIPRWPSVNAPPLPFCAFSLRLLNLCEPVRAMVEDGRLSGGHARALLPLPAKQQETAAAAVLKSELSVRQTELLAKKLMAETPEKPAKDPLSVNYAEEAARELGERLGRGCRIVSGRKKGRIELEYYGTDDLNDLLDALHAIKKK